MAITKKNQGYGTELFLIIFDYCFKQQNKAKLYLEVYQDNERAIKFYQKLGMHQDKTIEDFYVTDRGSVNQLIFSILKNEYQQLF